jgi:multidrug efflux pump subunit AcrB
MSMLIVMLGVFSLAKMPTDMLPEFDIPVVAVVWQYGGLPPDEMEQRITGYYERLLTTTVNGIEHIESQSLYGVSVTKVFFHPGTKVEMANAQVTAVSQTVLKFFPVGTTPPLIVNYSASNVPILQGSVHSDTLSEQQLFDLTSNFLRAGLATVQGVQMAFPYGGKQRQVMIDLDLPRLYSLGLSPSDVNNALQAQNVILPSGTAKLGDKELLVRLNSTVENGRDIAALPVKSVNGSTVTIGDVAQVRDGYAPQTSLVRANGRRGVLMTLLKSAGSSTIDIVGRVKNIMPSLLATLPPEYKMDLLFDQSLFVRAAVDGVMKEGVIAAGLTALMILLFLGSWRSTVIVVRSIPLSILVSFICLAALGHTVNLMTLGGLSLAVGILVDDATVELENVHRNMAMRKPIKQAILDGAQQIAVPAFVATLCICIVFVPIAFISGSARSLFTPLAMAVVFAMLTSYLLSRTLVPTMVHYLLASEVALYTGETPKEKRGFIFRLHERFNVRFEKARRVYAAYRGWALQRRRVVTAGFGVFVLASIGLLFPHLGRDFFPSVDAGQIRFHVRAAPGTRIETTERAFAKVERIVKSTIPESELETVIDNVGLPVSGINLTLGDPSMISSADGEVLVQLHEKHHAVKGYVNALRHRFAEEMPEAEVFFLAPDITTQVLNFGLSAQANVQGADLGSVSDAVQRIVAEEKKALPRGTQLVVRGQVESMNVVVNFQSWLDPVIILAALPGAIAGIVWALFATGTTLSVPAVMGAIMSIGVATSNSILMVTFANDRRREGDDSTQAAFLAGVTRLRPVLMTALAMVLGMLPMSLGLGEGGEQNAPLGRAVIGGLTMATLTTLFVVPVVYSAWRGKTLATEEEGATS